MTDTEEQSAIAQFFRGKSVFITGGTGFVGKQIIEKLLRSCPGKYGRFTLFASLMEQKGNELTFFVRREIFPRSLTRVKMLTLMI